MSLMKKSKSNIRSRKKIDSKELNPANSFAKPEYVDAKVDPFILQIGDLYDIV